MIDRACDPINLVGPRHRLSELAHLGQTPDEPVARKYGCQDAGFHAFIASITPKDLHAPPEALYGLSIVSDRLQDHPDALGRPCLESAVIVGDGKGKSPLGQLKGAIRVTGHPGERREPPQSSP